MLKPLLALSLALGLLLAPCGVAKKKPPAQPVNLNSANSEQLQQVPGIGPATADKILQMRKSYGSFRSVKRPYGHPWDWAEAPGENEEIFDGYETAGEKARPARKLYWMFEGETAPTHEGCCHTEKSAQRAARGGPRIRAALIQAENTKTSYTFKIRRACFRK
jgi:Helix-hairpin-helix motif